MQYWSIVWPIVLRAMFSTVDRWIQKWPLNEWKFVLFKLHGYLGARDSLVKFFNAIQCTPGTFVKV